MDMKIRTIRDGIVLVAAFHYFLALLSLIGAAAIWIYLILPPVNAGAANLAQQIFFPAAGSIVGLVLTLVYVAVGTGLMRYSNPARITSIFLSILGLMSGFAGVVGSILIRLGGPTLPNLVSVFLIAAVSICVYSLIAFMDFFVLIFLFNSQVRSAFYGEPWAVEADDSVEIPAV
jgi:hypothetical protein